MSITEDAIAGWKEEKRISHLARKVGCTIYRLKAILEEADLIHYCQDCGVILELCSPEIRKHERGQVCGFCMTSELESLPNAEGCKQLAAALLFDAVESGDFRFLLSKRAEWWVDAAGIDLQAFRDAIKRRLGMSREARRCREEMTGDWYEGAGAKEPTKSCGTHPRRGSPSSGMQ